MDPNLEEDTPITSTYRSNQPMQHSLPDRPQIKIPVPTFEYQGNRRSLIIPSGCVSVIRANPQYGGSDFVDWLAREHPLQFEHSACGWKYQDRSAARSILPFLYLGPMTVARDVKSVRSAGYTMLVAVRSKVAATKIPRLMNPAHFESATGIAHATFDFDAPFEAIRGHAAIIKTMNDHIQSCCGALRLNNTADIPAKILVFCETGNERSAVLVAMYLMVVWGIDAVSAYQAVQSRRFSTAIDSEMVDMLDTLGQVLLSERQVTVDRMAPDRLGDHEKLRTAKRDFGQFDTAEADEDFEPQGAEASNRPGVMPFKDASV